MMKIACFYSFAMKCSIESFKMLKAFGLDRL